MTAEERRALWAYMRAEVAAIEINRDGAPLEARVRFRAARTELTEAAHALLASLDAPPVDPAPPEAADVRVARSSPSGGITGYQGSQPDTPVEVSGVGRQRLPVQAASGPAFQAPDESKDETRVHEPKRGRGPAEGEGDVTEVSYVLDRLVAENWMPELYRNDLKYVREQYRKERDATCAERAEAERLLGESDVGRIKAAQELGNLRGAHAALRAEHEALRGWIDQALDILTPGLGPISNMPGVGRDEERRQIIGRAITALYGGKSQP